MTPYLERLATFRRFGMRPGLGTMREICAALGDPGRMAKTIHIAGTNGKGAVAAIIDAALRAAGYRTFRYTSPHLLRLNERFFIDGEPAPDALLDRLAERVERAAAGRETTFFEALTAVAFLSVEEAKPDFAILETGLGGRLDATNVCSPALTVVTKIGLDHCDWLGGTIAEIAAEKAGIAKAGVPLVIGENPREALDALERRAREVGAPVIYAPDIASEGKIPPGFSLEGSFNRENAVTAIAALKTLFPQCATSDTGPKWASLMDGFGRVVWPGRFQRVGNFIIDGAHNPPAANALVRALDETGAGRMNLVAGFCGDKDSDEVLRILAPRVAAGFAVRTSNPRSLPSEDVAAKMKSAGIDAIPCETVESALRLAGSAPTLICGSLFLAGEVLALLGAYPWPAGDTTSIDPSEILSDSTL
jgi:dihydrofolate synthase/folylpolyglutamate synthase